MNDSRISDGLTQSRYPSCIVQIIPPFSLWWVGMMHDYYCHVPDDGNFVRSLLPGIRSATDWFCNRLDKDQLLGALEWWAFSDWTDGWRFGTLPGAKESRTTFMSLQLTFALLERAHLEDAFGNAGLATEARERAQRTADVVRYECCDLSEARVVDTSEHQMYWQHAAILAVLADAVPAEEQARGMERTLTDTSLAQATFYFRFYLARALVKVGLGDKYHETLGPWYEMLRQGLTTWAEKPNPTRSCCHAWSASPEYELLATVLEITPDASGFSRVRIAPHLGRLTTAMGKMPHPHNKVAVSYQRDGERLATTVVLPEGIEDSLVWQGKQHVLHGGEHTVTL